MDKERPKIEVKDELERFMILHGFNSIERVLELPTDTLLSMDGFGMRLVVEVERLRREFSASADSKS